MCQAQGEGPVHPMLITPIENPGVSDVFARWVKSDIRFDQNSLDKDRVVMKFKGRNKV